MEFKEITAKDNPKIKLISALQASPKTRKESGLFVLEGLRLLNDAAENDVGFESLIVSKTAMEKYAQQIKLLARNAAETVRIPDHLFEKISDTKSPQGICAVSKMKTHSVSEIDPKGKYVLLDGLADPANLGAIARTGEALGISGLIVTGDTCDPYAPKSLRASMGTLLRLPVFRFEDVIKNSGLTFYACVVDADALDIATVSFSPGSALVIGNEANGISDAIKRWAQYRITIPMSGRTESLNAAAAAAIAVWEMMR